MRVSVDGAGRIVLPKQIREAVGLTGGQEVEVRLVGVVIEIEPVQPVVRMRARPGKLPVLEVEGDVELVSVDEPLPQLDEAFKQISDELRTQYLLAYYPSQHLSDSEFRRIQVKVDGVPDASNLKVRHRTGYYTAKSTF